MQLINHHVAMIHCLSFMSSSPVGYFSQSPSQVCKNAWRAMNFSTGSLLGVDGGVPTITESLQPKDADEKFSRDRYHVVSIGRDVLFLFLLPLR